eukprot:snap_masked-scaffold_104-processed-gene-0.18-mRNA-1 protein AED:1.00 eAED:1.00 QI:0/-1/0/0/-1/1/1/0/67
MNMIFISFLISLKEASRTIQEIGNISYLDTKLEIDTYNILPKQPSQKLLGLNPKLRSHLKTLNNRKS